MTERCRSQSGSDFPTAGSRWIRLLLVAILLISGVYFLWRSIPRALTDSHDLAVGYTAAHALLCDKNPYDPEVLTVLLRDHGSPQLAEQRIMDFYRNIYFPTTLPVFIPLTVVSWPVAKVVWLLLNFSAVIVICLGLLRYTKVRPLSNRGMGFLAFTIALAPIHSTIGMGQTAVLSVAALVVAMLLEKGDRGKRAGIAYALATAVKIQIGLPFIAYLLWRRRWPTAATAIGLLLGLTLFSVGLMQSADASWYDCWKTNLVYSTTNGGVNDPTLANPYRHSMIGLQVLLHCFTDNRQLVNGLTFALVVGTALYAMYYIRGRYPQRNRELLALAIVGVLGLLVTYHRTYDTVLLVLPLALIFSGPIIPLNIVMAFFCAQFIVPFQSMWHSLAEAGWLSGRVSGSPLWACTFLSHQMWAILGVLVLLMIQGVRRVQSRVDEDTTGT